MLFVRQNATFKAYLMRGPHRSGGCYEKKGKNADDVSLLQEFFLRASRNPSNSWIIDSQYYPAAKVAR
jgi:hypothetical protein